MFFFFLFPQKNSDLLWFYLEIKFFLSAELVPSLFERISIRSLFSLKQTTKKINRTNIYLKSTSPLSISFSLNYFLIFDKITDCLMINLLFIFLILFLHLTHLHCPIKQYCQNNTIILNISLHGRKCLIHLGKKMHRDLLVGIVGNISKVTCNQSILSVFSPNELLFLT